mmetsp:Transcript_8321/g.51866  ORF Transcript_8321/g.51866 Transcript_8321/m.51866 type:complete len:133 (-) Transcript_8321:1396-1794(-)
MTVGESCRLLDPPVGVMNQTRTALYDLMDVQNLLSGEHGQEKKLPPTLRPLHLLSSETRIATIEDPCQKTKLGLKNFNFELFLPLSGTNGNDIGTEGSLMEASEAPVMTFCSCGQEPLLHSVHTHPLTVIAG